jgi:hypothetical protein
MRAFYSLPLAILALTAAPAQAAKILILTDPMTLERRMVVIEQPGPDRVYLCALPPSVAGCRDVTPRAR